jgi:hypothetical protein
MATQLELERHMDKITPYLPFLLSQKDTSEESNWRDLLEREQRMIKRDLEAWDKIPFYRANGIRLPDVAKKSASEIEDMKKRYKQMEKELGPQ